MCHLPTGLGVETDAVPRKFDGPRKNRSARGGRGTYSGDRMGVRRSLYALISSALIVASAGDAATMPPRLYEVITETVMPHLEENLRYATTREQRCLEADQLW